MRISLQSVSTARKVKPLSDCRLYAFIDTAYLHGRAPDSVARQLCDGGADLIQLRAKDSKPDEIRRMAESILPVTQNAGIALVVNDYPQIALEVGAEFCHLGLEDFAAAGCTHVSQLPNLSPGLRIGLSTHSPEEARRAVSSGAAYLGVGPVFPTGTKPDAKPVTLEYVRWAAANVSTPWFAIGGINLQNLDQVIEAGARRVCAVSAILNSDEIPAVCRAFKQRLA